MQKALAVGLYRYKSVKFSGLLMLKINLLNAFEKKPPVPEFAWPEFQCGTVGLLTVQVGAAVANGMATTDTLGLNPQKVGGVLLLSVEDTSVAITGRLHELARELEAA